LRRRSKTVLSPYLLVFTHLVIVSVDVLENEDVVLSVLNVFKGENVEKEQYFALGSDQ
jgi:hypothetical protein